MGYESWGNVAYFFQWKLDVMPDSLTAWENKSQSNAESLEVGWKRTGGADCNRTLFSFFGSGPFNGTAGFPAAVSTYVDFTEANDDAVLFVADMDVVAADQRANPNKLYSAWWNCAGPFMPSQRPYFNVQQGGGEHPSTSFSNGQLNYVPAEHGSKGFPDLNPQYGTHKSTGMYAPWTVYNANFETGTAGWYTGAASQEWLCSGGAGGAGACYLRVHPTGPSPNWAYTSMYVANSVAYEEQGYTRLTTGSATGFQYEGMHRCPSSYNSSNCVYDLWLKPRNGSGWDPAKDRRSFVVPNDNRWYYILVDDWSAGGPTDIVDLYHDTRGKVLDIDSQWVSGGI
ncbi:MAG: hypothetical protein ACR2FO_09280 [Actinomycetota bacterium]